MSLVWLLAGLSLVACSDKEKTGGYQHCDQYGYCYDPGNPGFNYPPPGTAQPGSGIYYGKNGNLQNVGDFKEFNRLLTGFNQKDCWGSKPIGMSYKPFSCNDIYVSVGPGYGYGNDMVVTLATPRLHVTGNMAQLGARLVLSNTSETVYEVLNTLNYTYYVVAELRLIGDINTATTMNYQLIYRTNANATVISAGTMRKGYDF